MQVVRIGLDLAKYVFAVHGVDARGNIVLRMMLRRDSVLRFFANLPPCLMGMDASNGAHYWARVLTDLGHQVRLISPQFVTPYVKSNKNDRNDAEAICEAVGRPSMRFAPPKSDEQLAVQAVHRIRRRQFAAWLGLVPKQRSSGGRARLFGISKRGDRYLRTLMIHGARAALGRAGGKQDPRGLWLGKLRERRHPNVAAVALANKNARIVWSMLSGHAAYQPDLSVKAA
ncbi:transposase [Mesorhizobium sp. WSM2239]|uniref:Transposase n=2 Tax=unclassified Mesorhizobium TaxID=325217 RepID=A0AAU8D6S5_9HYPH